MFRRTFLFSLAFIAAVAAAEPAFAQRHGRDRDGGHEDRPFDNQFQRGPGDQWNAPQQQREVPLSSIVRDIGRQFGGRQLDSTRRGDRWVIGWITQDGRRLTIEADAVTGRILSTRG
jgi:hypothetical protein